jgi:large subunit ribosomal protein L32e
MTVNGADKKRLMKLKKKMSQKRPKFRRFESWRFVRIKDHWRKPKGIDNHMRLNLRGWPKVVNVGYRSPKQVRHLHPSGNEEVAVHNVGDLAIIDPETQVARIGGSVGTKKRINIIREADLRSIRVLNPGKARKILLEESEEEDLIAEDASEESLEVSEEKNLISEEVFEIDEEESSKDAETEEDVQ